MRIKRDQINTVPGTQDVLSIFLYNYIPTTYHVDQEDDSVTSRYWQSENSQVIIPLQFLTDVYPVYSLDSL